MSPLIEDHETKLNEYQAAALATAVYPAGDGALTYTVLALAGEAGELANRHKKVLRGDANAPEIHKAQMVGELGDILWYLAACSKELGVSLEYVAQYNLAKLRRRKEAGAIQGDGDSR